MATPEIEIWKDITGFEGKYKVSNKGNVYSYKSGRNLKPYKDFKNYRRVDLFGNDLKRKVKKVHRLVAEMFIPNPDSLPQVNHKDMVTYNNEVNNLEWTDNSGNQKHSWENGRICKIFGENNGNSKLTSEIVLDIRKSYKNKETVKDIMKRLDLSRTTVYRIIRKESWNHLEDV